MQQKKVKGFTILELLVVIAIIAVISGVAIPQFANWGKEREVKNSAERIKNLVISINSQVQRGLYGFAQFNIKPLTGGGYSLQTNGMLMSNLATNISETDDWYKTSVRCKNEDAYWDHLGKSNNRAEVRSFDIDNVGISISSESGVCFSKDGSWFSSFGELLDSESVILGMYICGNKDEECPGGSDEGGDYDMDILYELSWTRFGNIKLERYDNKRKQWIVQ
jgi:prepilin-type N-terminal cleavage/methylation domain-containing protein